MEKSLMRPASVIQVSGEQILAADGTDGFSSLSRKVRQWKSDYSQGRGREKRNQTASERKDQAKRGQGRSNRVDGIADEEEKINYQAKWSERGE
ncbi:hypothetical protein VTN49DRAFT_4601 [Thermomyces lanuginosus]|uniref:uncharacterized protein n=1 Tax=Thermomyces lanuginosus TaxID=5541 RepID=UPI003743B92D